MLIEKTVFDGTHLIRVVVDNDTDSVEVFSAMADREDHRVGPWEKSKWSQSDRTASPYADRLKLLSYVIKLLVSEEESN